MFYTATAFMLCVFFLVLSAFKTNEWMKAPNKSGVVGACIICAKSICATHTVFGRCTKKAGDSVGDELPTKWNDSHTNTHTLFNWPRSLLLVFGFDGDCIIANERTNETKNKQCSREQRAKNLRVEMGNRWRKRNEIERERERKKKLYNFHKKF